MHQNAPHQVLLWVPWILLAIVAVPASANFGGYVGTGDGLSASLLSPQPSPTVRLAKERLFFDLGQRVSVKGQFWLENTGEMETKINLAFPQVSLIDWSKWPVEYSEEAGWKIDPSFVLRNGFERLRSSITIDGRPQAVTESYSWVDPARKDFSQPFRLVSLPELPAEIFRHGVGEPMTVVPFLIWNVVDARLGPGQTSIVEIQFTRNWNYQDSWMSYHLQGQPLRTFEYITQTAGTWKDGTIDDFEATITIPAAVGSNLEPAPAGWAETAPGTFVLRRKAWKPAAADAIVLTWRSSHLMVIDPDGDDACDVHFGSYSGRFLTDGADGTAWCVPAKDAGCTAVLFRDAAAPAAPATRIRITNGYAANDSLFSANARPARIAIRSCAVDGTVDDEYSFASCTAPFQELALEDTREPREYPLSTPATAKDNVMILQLRGITKGKSSGDICISELRLR